MKTLVALLDPPRQLQEWLCSVAPKFGLSLLVATSLKELLTLLGSKVPGLILLPQSLSARDTQFILKSYPRSHHAMIFGAGGGAFGDTAGAIFQAIKAGISTWNLQKAKKLILSFLHENLLAIRPGTRISGYKIGAWLSAGAFGDVRRATEILTGRVVAVKIIHDAKRLERELEALCKAVNLRGDSSHLIPILHVAYFGRRLCIFMPLAEMITLPTGKSTPASVQALLEHRGGPLDATEALTVTRSVLSGLKDLHDAGLQHGDVAARNVVKLDGRYVLTDFSLTRFLGDPGIYLPPDYYPNPPTGLRSDDLFAAGALYFQITTGKHPSKLDSLTLDLFERSNIPSLRVIARACSREPDERYEFADQMLADIANIQPAQAAL